MTIIDRLKELLWSGVEGPERCSQARFLISKEMDKKLGWRERLQLRTHLPSCRACTYYRQNLWMLRYFINAFCATHNKSERLSWKLSPEAKERMQRLIQKEIKDQEKDFPSSSQAVAVFRVRYYWSSDMAAKPVIEC